MAKGAFATTVTSSRNSPTGRVEVNDRRLPHSKAKTLVYERLKAFVFRANFVFSYRHGRQQVVAVLSGTCGSPGPGI